MNDDGRDAESDSGDKKAHHNALERRRRDHIKESFTTLRRSLPTIGRSEKASRALILKKAADYIMKMSGKNDGHQIDIHDLREENQKLERQVLSLEKKYDFPSDRDALEINEGETACPGSPNSLEVNLSSSETNENRRSRQSGIRKKKAKINLSSGS
ncbi:Protein max [Nymphon striatum]|nr:Protein max [Nymphon striatum]